LSEIVRACRTPRRFPGSLDGGQEQADERTDYRDHDQEFDKGETATRMRFGKALEAGEPDAEVRFHAKKRLLAEP
jgi:hypothetical protein